MSAAGAFSARQQACARHPGIHSTGAFVMSARFCSMPTHALTLLACTIHAACACLICVMSTRVYPCSHPYYNSFDSLGLRFMFLFLLVLLFFVLCCLRRVVVPRDCLLFCIISTPLRPTACFIPSPCLRLLFSLFSVVFFLIFWTFHFHFTFEFRHAHGFEHFRPCACRCTPVLRLPEGRLYREARVVQC